MNVRKTKPSRKRYMWAGELAASVMGKRKVWGDKPQSVADEDPLAWWCLTELIATGGTNPAKGRARG